MLLPVIPEVVLQSECNLPIYQAREAEAWETLEAYSHICGAMAQFCNGILMDLPMAEGLKSLLVVLDCLSK